MKILILFFLLTVLTLTAYSQDWHYAKKIGDSGNEYVSGIAIDKDGNSYIIGRFKQKIILDTISISGSNTQNIFIAKFDRSGNTIWAKTVASAIDTLLDAVNINAIAVDGLENVYVTGNYLGNALFFGTKHTSVASSEIYLIKLTNNGDLIWMKTAGGNGVGNYNQNEAYACCIDNSGNCILTGRYFKTATFDTVTISASLPNELFVAKYNNNGRIVWVKSGGGDFGIHNGFGIASDSNDNVYVTGDFFGHLTIGDNNLDAIDAEQKIFIAKFSSAGQSLWAKKVGTGSYYGIGSGITVDKRGNAYIAGFFRSTIDFGTMQLTFSRPVIAYAMLEVKYDSNGNFGWAVKSDGADQNTQAIAICSDGQGNSYVTGSFTSNILFGSNSLVKDTGLSIFVTKLDPEGKFLWAKQTGGDGNSNGREIALTNDGKIVVAGGFSSDLTFDSIPLSSSGGFDIFIANIVDQKQTIKQPFSKEEIVYPNPADETLHLSTRQNLVLLDVVGRTVVQCNDCNEIYTAEIPAGAYYLNGQLVIIRH